MALLWTAVGHGQRESLGQSSGGEGRARPQRRGRACVRSGSALHERGGGAACEHRHGPRQGTHSHARHTGSAGVALAWSRRRLQQRQAQVSAHHRPGAVKTGVADVGSWVVTCRAGPLAKGEAWDVAPGGGGHLTLGGHRQHREWGGGRAGRTAPGRVDIIYPSLSAWVTGCTQRPQWARRSLSGSYSSHREVQNATLLQRGQQQGGDSGHPKSEAYVGEGCSLQPPLGQLRGQCHSWEVASFSSSTVLKCGGFRKLSAQTAHTGPGEPLPLAP